MDAVRKAKFLRDVSQPKKCLGNPVFQNHYRKRVPNGKWITEQNQDEDKKSVIRESTGVKNDILEDWLTYNRKSTPMTYNYHDTVISNSKNDHFTREINALDCISSLVSSSSSINRANERRKKDVAHADPEMRRIKDARTRSIEGKDHFLKKISRLHKTKKSVRGQKTINFDDEIWPTCPKLFNSEELLAKNEETDLPDDELLGDSMVHPLPTTDIALFRSSITSAERCVESCRNEKILVPTREADCGNDVPVASETILNRDSSVAKLVSAKTRAPTTNHGYDPGKHDEMRQKTVYEIRVPPDYVSPLGAPPTIKVEPVLRERMDSKSKQDGTSEGSVTPVPNIQVMESSPAQRPLQRSRSKKPKTMSTSFAVELVNDATICEEHAGSVLAESKESCRFDCLGHTGNSLVCDEPMISKRKINRDKIQKPAGPQPVWKPAGHNQIRSNPNILPKHVTRHGGTRRKGIRNERSPREGKTYRRSRPAAGCFTSGPRRLSNSFGLQLHRSLAKMNMKAKEYQSDSMFLRRSRTQISTESSGARSMKVRLKSRTRSRNANETKVPELPSPREALRDSSALGSLDNDEREEFSSIAIADALKELLDLEIEHSTMGQTTTTIAQCSIVVNTVESKIIDDLGTHEEKAEEIRTESASPANEGSMRGVEDLEPCEEIAEVSSESVDGENQESCRPEERYDSSVDCSTTDLLASWNESVTEESNLPLTSHFGCIVDLSSEDSIGRSTTTGLSKASLASTSNTDRTQKMTTERESMKDSSTLTTASQTASNESSSQSGRTLATTSEQFHPYGGSSTVHKPTPEPKYFERRVKSLHLLKKILSDQGMDTRLLVRAERKLKQKRSMGRRCIVSSRCSLQMDQPSSKDSRVVIDKGTSTQLCRNIDASSNTKSDHALSRLRFSEENSEAKTIERNKSGTSMPSLEDSSRVPEKCTRSSDSSCSQTPPKLCMPADILEAFRLATIRAANLYKAVRILKDHRRKVSEDTSVIDSSSNTTFGLSKKKVDAKAEPDHAAGSKDGKAAVNRLRTVRISEESFEVHRVQVPSPGKSSGTVLTSEARTSNEETVLNSNELASRPRRGQTEQPVQIVHSSNLPKSISSVENADERASQSKRVSMLSDGIETLHFAGRERIENDTDDGSRADEAPKQILQPQTVSRIKELLTKNLEHFKTDLHQAPSCILGQCSDESCSSGDEASLSCDQAGALVPEWCEVADGRTTHHAETMSIHNYLSDITETTNGTTEVNQQCGLRRPQPQCCRSDKGLQTLRGAKKSGYCTGQRGASMLHKDEPNMRNKLMFVREHLLSIIYGTICLAVFWCLRFSLHCEV